MCVFFLQLPDSKSFEDKREELPGQTKSPTVTSAVTLEPKLNLKISNQGNCFTDGCHKIKHNKTLILIIKTDWTTQKR